MPLGFISNHRKFSGHSSSVILSSADSCRNIHIYAGYIPMQIFASHFICKVRKSCSRFACERVFETEQNWNILTSTLMTVNVVSFSFFWCSTGGFGVHSAGCWLSLRILSASSLDPNSSGPKWPLQTDVAFPTTSRLQLSASPLAHRTQLSYIIVRRPLDLWNRMFNRHQAEITVMQFRGHSLPVHHSVVAQWDLPLVPYYQP